MLPVPLIVVGSDLYVTKRRAALVTLERLRREKQNGDVHREDNKHGDEDGPACGESKNAAKAEC